MIESIVASVLLFMMIFGSAALPYLVEAKKIRPVTAILLFLAWWWCPIPAFAQQPADPAVLQKALAVLAQQRNAALDGQAQVQVQAVMQSEEIAKLKARIAELEKAPPPAPGK